MGSWPINVNGAICTISNRAKFVHQKNHIFSGLRQKRHCLNPEDLNCCPTLQKQIHNISNYIVLLSSTRNSFVVTITTINRNKSRWKLLVFTIYCDKEGWGRGNGARYQCENRVQFVHWKNNAFTGLRQKNIALTRQVPTIVAFTCKSKHKISFSLILYCLPFAHN